MCIQCRHKKEKPVLEDFPVSSKRLKDVLDNGLPTVDSIFTRLILNRYSIELLYGKAIKDKRGGKNNIHSWDIDYKGVISARKKLLNFMLKERSKKKWEDEYGIEWMECR